MVKCTLFSEYCRPNAIELDKSIFDDESSTTAEHFRFQCESLKLNLMALCFVFNLKKKNVTSIANE